MNEFSSDYETLNVLEDCRCGLPSLFESLPVNELCLQRGRAGFCACIVIRGARFANALPKAIAPPESLVCSAAELRASLRVHDQPFQRISSSRCAFKCLECKLRTDPDTDFRA